MRKIRSVRNFRSLTNSIDISLPKCCFFLIATVLAVFTVKHRIFMFDYHKYQPAERLFPNVVKAANDMVVVNPTVLDPVEHCAALPAPEQKIGYRFCFLQIKCFCLKYFGFFNAHSIIANSLTAVILAVSGRIEIVWQQWSDHKLSNSIQLNPEEASASTNA